MKIEPRGPQAARIRQRKFEILRCYRFPADLMAGSLCLQQVRCGKATCHCSDGEGHPVTSLLFTAGGKQYVQRVPKSLVERVRQHVEAGRAYQEALREVMVANAQLFVLARKQRLI